MAVCNESSLRNLVDILHFSTVITLIFCIAHFVEISGDTTLTPLCGNTDVYDIEQLKKATYWQASAPGRCYDSYNTTKPCDFYFSFCKYLPTSLTGGTSEVGAVQNETVSGDNRLVLGGYSQISADTSGSLIIIGFNGGGQVACGRLSGILMYLHCQPDTSWPINVATGHGVIPEPIEVELYNTTGACSYRIDVRYDGACTKIGPSAPTGDTLSPGSILIIITLTVYLVGGVLLNCYAGGTGLELLPNIEFWKSLPSLIADGAIFFWTSLTCQPGGGSQGTGYDSI